MPPPILLSVTVYDDRRDALVFVFDRPVTASSFVDIAPTFSAGTQRDIIGGFRPDSVAGSGTDTLHAALSGAVAQNDVATVAFGARSTVYSLDGYRLAAGSIAVTNRVGGGGGGGVVPVPGAIVEINHSSSATVLARAQNVRVNVTAGAPPTITTDSTPGDGDLFTITDVAGLFGTTACVITANAGQTIEDPAASPGTYSATATLAASSESFTWEYIAPLVRWKAVR